MREATRWSPSAIGRPGRWLLLGLTLLILGESAVVVVLVGLVRATIVDEHDRERQALLGQCVAAVDTVLAEHGTAPVIADHLRLLRDSWKLDVLSLVDADHRLVAAPHLPLSTWGGAADVFLVDPAVVDRALREEQVQVVRLTIFDEAVERLVAPVATGDRVLVIDRHDELASLADVLRWPLLAGLGLAVLLAVLIVGALLTTLRLLRRAQERVARVATLSTLGTLAAGIAHEVRNPLAIATAAIDLVKGQPDLSPADRGELLLTVEEELGRIDDQVDALLDVARNQPLDRRPVSLTVLVDQVQRLLRVQSGRVGVELEAIAVAPEAGSALVFGDERRLRQVLVNLYLNAIEAQPQGGRVSTLLRRRESELILILRDQGPGFDPAILARWGEPFVTSKPEGTGLGLLLCKRTLQRHGGRLVIANTPTGAEVRCHLGLWTGEDSATSGRRPRHASADRR